MEHQAYDLSKVAFLPLTGNPVGFHHLLLAECVLHQFDSIEQVVFLLSNGQHPDPTKARSIVDKYIRLELMEMALKEYINPETSHVAQLAQQEKFKLKLNPSCSSVATAEFDVPRAVRLNEHLLVLQKHALSPAKPPEAPQNLNDSGPANSMNLPEPPRVQLIVGTDLVHRMRNSQIFSDYDLSVLCKQAKLLIASRPGYIGETEKHRLERSRRISLTYDWVDIHRLPDLLKPLLNLSSTIIRRAIQAHHVFTAMVPSVTAVRVASYGLYQTSAMQIRLREWEHQCYVLDQQLEETAIQLKTLLDQRADQGLTHTWAVVETSTGGKIASVFTGIPGASRHFLEGIIAYDRTTQERLLDQPIKGSVVSEKMAQQLVEAVSRHTNADFVLGETGMAGLPEGKRHSQKNGQCHLALHDSNGVRSQLFQSNPYFTKKEHQLMFANAAVTWLIQCLEQGT